MHRKVQIPKIPRVGSQVARLPKRSSLCASTGYELGSHHPDSGVWSEDFNP